MSSSPKILLSLVLILNSFPTLLTAQETRSNANPDDEWIEEYRPLALDIIDFTNSDEALFWKRLAYLTDYYPHRLSGSTMLEGAIDYLYDSMKADGFDRVFKQEVMVPHWERNEESARFIGPYEKALRILGLGRSVGTPPEGIRAPVLVVNSFEDLEARADEAEGKIILWNVPFTTYGETVQYRVRGAVEAARVGAVGSLLRSVSPYSSQTPHTGGMRYEEGVPKIPSAAISIEEAELMQRFQDRGEPFEVLLKMGAKTHPDALSHNLIAELKGWEKTNEYVVIGGHIDSWDTGQGVMDNASGVIVAWEALRILKALGFQPRRTIRVVAWTNEENGLRGGRAYLRMVEEDGTLQGHQLAFEADAGVFQPYGFGFSGTDEAFEILQPILQLTGAVGVTEMRRGSSGVVDVGPLHARGVPIMGINTDRERYFWYHHSETDTLDKQDPKDIAKVIAATAILAAVTADMEPFLPRTVYPSPSSSPSSSPSTTTEKSK